MMIEALNNKGYNGYSISLPSPDQLLEIFMLAAPVFVTMMSKVFHVFLDSTSVSHLFSCYFSDML